jgi:hypothetical protein
MHQKISTTILEIESLPSSFKGEIDIFYTQASSSFARFIHDQTPSDGLGEVYNSPDILLEPGKYQVVYTVKAVQILPGAQPLRLEVLERDTGSLLASESTDVQGLTLDEYDEITTEFSIQPSNTRVNIRAIYSGGGAYWFDYLEIQKTSKTLENMAYITWPLLTGVMGLALYINRAKVLNGISINAALRHPSAERYMVLFGNLALVGFWLYAVLGKYLLDTERLVYAFLADDAFYYFETAANLAQKGVLSFDGITFTNGFHPLWLLLLTAIYLIGMSKEISLITGLFVADVLWLASTLLLFWGLRRKVNIFLAFGSMLLFISNAIYPLQYGLETAVLVASFVALLVFYASRFRNDLSDIPYIDCIILGFLLSLTVLARLDHGIFAVVFLVFMLTVNWRSLRSRETWNKFGMILAILLAIILPYLIFNYLSTGYIIPFSGLVKGVWSQNILADALRLTTYIQAKIDNIMMVLSIQRESFWPLVGSLLILWLLAARRRLDSWKTLIPFILGPAAILGFYLLCFQYPFNSVLWYYPTIWLAGILTISLVVDRLLNLFRVSSSLFNRGIMIGAAAALLVFQFISQVDHQRAFFHWIRTRSYEDTYKYLSWQAGEFIQSHTWSSGADGETVFASADAGVIAYVLDMPVINLDGLINNEILTYEIQGKHWYLYTIDQSKIDYVVNVFKEDLVAPPLFEQHFSPCYISTDFGNETLGFRIYGRRSVLTGDERGEFTAGCVEGQMSSWRAVELQEDRQTVEKDFRVDSQTEKMICSNAWDAGEGPPMVSGPGVSLPAGTYEVDYFLSTGDNRDQSEVAHLSIARSTGEVLLERRVAGVEFSTPGEIQRFSVPFQLDQNMEGIDFRVHQTGEQTLCIQGVRLMECSHGCILP